MKLISTITVPSLPSSLTVVLVVWANAKSSTVLILLKVNTVKYASTSPSVNCGSTAKKCFQKHSQLFITHTAELWLNLYLNPFKYVVSTQFVRVSMESPCDTLQSVDVHVCGKKDAIYILLLNGHKCCYQWLSQLKPISTAGSNEHFHTAQSQMFAAVNGVFWPADKGF